MRLAASRQLALQFEAPEPLYRRENFVPPALGVSPLALLDAFLASGSSTLAISGPAGSGKTFLGRIALQALAPEAGGSPGEGARAPGGDSRGVFADRLHLGDDPALLLELMESARQPGLRVILAGEGEPRAWAHGLRDLETRLGAALRISLAEPDDGQLRAVLLRSFLDRQLRVPAAVLDFAAVRLAPTYGAVRDFVDAAFEELAATGQPINLALARRVLSRLSERDSLA